MTVRWDRDPHSAAFHVAPGEHDSLPHPLTSLVGRERVSAIVANTLGRGGVRLLTLTGSGGVGKTRLALDVAASQADAFRDGVCFVALASIADPGLVLPTIAREVGVPNAGARPLAEHLSLALRDRQMLVVLDNFEQVAAAAVPVAMVLAACPGLRFLVTSRVPLRVSGEHEFSVPPLDLPPDDGASTVELLSNPAVTLFAQRATALKAGFSLDHDTILTVAELCRRLGGVPLAIELAATRLKVLPPEEILARISTNLDVLAGGPQDQPARQRSIRATIEWSYDLLRPHQRQVLHWLALLVGGCPLDVAEVMGVHACEGEPAPEPILDVISGLIDANLVWQESGLDGSPRLRMLETIRQFALEKLETRGDSAARAWLVRWSTELADQAAAAFNGQGPGIWHLRLQQELPNVRVALTDLERVGDVEGVLRLVTGLSPLWSALGNEREGYRWLRSALGQCAGVAPDVRTDALALAARLANALGDPREASALAHAGLVLAESERAATGMADIHCVLGNIARGLGNDVEARARYDDALARYRSLGDAYNVGYTLIQLGKLGNLGTVERPGNPGDLAGAIACVEEALQIYRALENTWGIARALHQLGHLAYKDGDFASAASLSSEALDLFWTHGNLTEAASPLEDLADVAGATGHGVTAARLYGVAEALRKRLGVPMWPSYRPEYEQEVAVARTTLAQDRFDQEWQAGRALAMDVALAEARSLAESLVSETNDRSESRVVPPIAGEFGLTARELDVLRLLATGNSNKAIADSLFISVTTVKGHVRSLMDKLDLRSRTAVSAWAHRNDLA